MSKHYFGRLPLRLPEPEPIEEPDYIDEISMITGFSRVEVEHYAHLLPEETGDLLPETLEKIMEHRNYEEYKGDYNEEYCF